MKKIFMKALIPASLITTLAYAGGPEVEPPHATVIPYIDLMGGGAWRDIETPNIASPAVDGPVSFAYNAYKIFSNWGARAAVGMMFPYKPVLNITSEIGWGYYGQSTINTLGSLAVRNNFGNAVFVTDLHHVTFNTWGFDALMGANYNIYPNIDLFGKVGALIENVREVNQEVIRTGTVLSATPTVIFANTNTPNRTQALPEVVAGVEYMFTDWIGITVSYLHAFGGASSPLPSGSIRVNTAGTAFASINKNTQAPTIDAVFGGVDIHIPAV